MFSEKDKNQIQKRGSKLETTQSQIANFENGFPYLKIEDAASVGNGIIRLSNQELKKRINLYNKKVDKQRALW